MSFVDSKCPFLSTLRAFEDLQVFWRATLNKAPPTLVSSGVNLTKELVHTSGFVVCRKGEIICAFALETRDDDVRPDIDLSEIALHFSQVLTDSGVNKKKNCNPFVAIGTGVQHLVPRGSFSGGLRRHH